MLRCIEAVCAAAVLTAALPLRAQAPEWLDFKDYSQIRTLHADGDSIWIRTGDGMVLFDPVSGTASLPGPRGSGGTAEPGQPDWSRVGMVRSAPGGGKCALQNRADLWLYAQGTWTLHVADTTGLIFGFTDLACGDDGEAWLSTTGGVLGWVGGKWKWVRPPPESRAYPGDSVGRYVSLVRLDPSGTPYAMVGGSIYRIEGDRFAPVFYQPSTGGNPAPLSDPAIDLAFDTEGDGLWVVTASRMFHLQTSTQKWSVTRPFPVAGLWSGSAPVFFGASGKITLGTAAGLFRLEAGTWNRAGGLVLDSIPGYLIDWILDGQERLWVSTSEGLFGDFNGEWKKQVLFPEASDLPGARGFAFLPDGSTWSYRDSNRVMRFDGIRWDQKAATDAALTDIASDGDTLWLGTKTGPQCFVDARMTAFPELEALYRIGDKGGDDFWLPPAKVNGMAVEKPGRIWFATNGGLLLRDHGDFTLFDVSRVPIVRGPIHSVAAEPDNLWAMDDAGLLHFQSGTWSRVPVPGPAESAYPGQPDGLAIGKDHKPWLVRNGNVYRRDGDVWNRLYRPYLNAAPGVLPNHPALNLDFDADGRAYLTASDGLVIYDGTHWKKLFPGNSGFPDSYRNLIAVDPRGNVWLAGAAGITLYRQGGLDLPLARRTAGNAARITSTLPLAGRILPGRSLPVPAAAWRAEIFSLDGRKLRDLNPVRAPDGTWRILWDGADAAGRRPPGGISLYRIRPLPGPFPAP